MPKEQETEFEQWWNQHSIHELNCDPLLEAAFKELAEITWSAAMAHVKDAIANAR